MKWNRGSVKKVAVILGTRPEAIKLAPVILRLKSDSDIDCRVCVTSQHRELLEQALQVFGVRPDTDLGLMEHDQNLSDFTARAIPAVHEYIRFEEPDLILIQGDTTSVLCAALAAFYRRVPVGHVEAGLRTGNLDSPWPEEANRELVSRLASLHFAPTEANRDNLIKEGISPERIFVTGNTVVDALFYVLDRNRENPPQVPGINESDWQQWIGNPLVLVTGHRRENFGAGLKSVCNALSRLAQRFPEVQFVYPVHLNPNVRGPVMRILGNSKRPNIHLIEPVPYDAFVALMDRATLILTDSGGIQEEAPSLGKPVLVTRNTSERNEAIVQATAKLVGTGSDDVYREVTLLLTDTEAYQRMARISQPFGDGHAAERIHKICAEKIVERGFLRL